MIEGKTTSGFEYSIEEYKLDNWELLEVLNELGDSPNKIVSVLPYLFDDEQIKALKEHNRDKKTGVVKASGMTADIMDIFKNNKAKN
jgi:hypothetical protein